MNYLELLDVSKPIRYINQEINSYHKNIEKNIHMCLVFPDIYEVGMSHLGIKILYERLNSDSHIFCERFFMPQVDAIDKFKEDIFVSLESGTLLKKFDILGFSLQYELSYTNMLKILESSKIPILSKDRDENHPVIIAGGPCALNPHPISEIIDCFFMGEMDDILPEVIVEVFHSNVKREEKLRKLNSFPFTYVPSIEKQKIVKRRIYENFHKDITLKNPLLPLMPIVQDRVVAEISRGCTRGCRFCQAGIIYRPSRERNVSDIINDILRQIESTGYLETSLLSLSAADYSCLNTLLVNLSERLRDRNISISLPSVRADKIYNDIFKELKKVRKSGFTIAPEAGSQRMRNIINKNLSEEDIVNSVKMASDNGFNGAKLYFMIGLPFETVEDVKEIGYLAIRIKKAVRKNFNITVSVSNFVPKPFTPFQWIGQNSVEEFLEKQAIIKDILRNTKIVYKFHDPFQSVIEGAISRGNENLNNLFKEALKLNSIFDGWSEHFDFKRWEKAFFNANLTLEETAYKNYQIDEKLSWDNIEVGVTKDYLVNELKKAESGSITEDCRNFNCTKCGVCDFKTIKNIDAATENLQIISDTFKKEDKQFKKVGLIFSKKGVSTLFSAIDINRIFSHSFNIAKIELDYSKGFNPQPKLSYLYPLPVGVSGENEILIGSIAEDSLDTKIKTLNNMLPQGLYFKNYFDATFIDLSKEMTATYTFDNDTFKTLINMLNSKKAFYEKVAKNGKIKKVDLSDYLISVENLTVKVKISNSGTFNFLEFFRYLKYNISKIEICRKDVQYI